MSDYDRDLSDARRDAGYDFEDHDGGWAEQPTRADYDNDDEDQS